MINKILSFFKKDDPEIEFYSIIPGLEEINQPVKAFHDENPLWLKSRLEKTKIYIDEFYDNQNLDPKKRDIFFIEKCPGIRSIMNEGIHLKTWQDIRVTLLSNDNSGKFCIETPTPVINLKNGQFINPEVQSHNGDQFPEFAKSRDDTWPHILKIMSNWRINMNKDWQLMLLPTYYSNTSHLFSAVPGIFNPEFGSHLNINIQIHKKAPFTFVIPAGTSIVKMIPIKKNNNFNFKVRKINQNDVEKEEMTLALLKKRYISSRKDQINDLNKIKSSISKCPFFHK
jgi:hypothetical protein